MTSEEQTISPQEKATVLASAIHDKKGEEIAILDVKELVDYVDYFVIATGTSQPHLDAMTDAVARTGERTLRPLGVEGRGSASWVLLDFGDVLVHLFSAQSRGFYDLDELWCDAPRVELDAEGQIATA